MRAWSEDTFGNDTACDWVGDFMRNPGLAVVAEAIQAVLEAQDYLDSDEACECLAAHEVIARLQGQWGVRNPCSEDLDKWIEANPTEVHKELKESADAAIERILAPNSELPELWDEGGRNEKWHNDIDNLRQRIKG